ncbi:CaiB/BaiF CoA-transferase family protein [Pandoraea sp. XY-2]|uniref:CaiB/BaiF CoA transferase family protein n=1 Tax=Pandoraea sp. XY-2 TaxID=2518599 RepID=UPI00101B209E|nr:CaiB/BaiF CoA-transferase family protein [Pandoraea sp. XY-2]QBC31034.1 CoA transferase [Pandoraea sp. XY-2]
MTQALEGIRILDVTNVLAGPFCGYQLALLGADVIKVETPGTGDLARQLGADPALNAELMGTSFLAQNAGKRSVTLNLKSEAGKAIFHKLAASADVVIENFRPGVMDRLGVGYDDLREINPRLVYCAISGFGQTGPLKDAPAYDQIVQGMSGVMSVTGDERSVPMRVGYPVADTLGGVTAAFAISAALVRRAATGVGTSIDVSMLDCMLASMGWVISNYLIAGQRPKPMGNENFTAAPSGTFETADGLLNIAANKQEQFVALVALLGIPELASDARFAQREARKRNRAELKTLIEAALKAKSAAEWAPALTGAGIPAGRVLDVASALAEPQVMQRRLVKSFRRAVRNERDVSVVLSGFKMREAEPDVACAPPALGEHTAQVLGELGFTSLEIEQLKHQGAV